jgi:HAD superfamily hydrolase (TIGR01509 family)
MIRALVLDFDGLILDTESVLIGAYAAVHRAHGVPFDAESFVPAIGHAEFAFDPWKAFGGDADRGALETERSRHNREQGGRLQPLPGVVALLDAALGSGLRLGVASNSGHGHVDGHLRRLGLLDRFDVVGCREDVPSPKPEPDLYRWVTGRMGLRGHEAVAFEDSPPGALAAKRAGMWVVAVPGALMARREFPSADEIVASLEAVDVAGLVRRFGSRDAVNA